MNYFSCRSILVLVPALLAFTTAANALHPDDVKLRIHQVYAGQFVWPDLNIVQDTFITLDAPVLDDSGNLLVNGKEFYRAETRYLPIDIVLSIDPRSLRVTITELPSKGSSGEEMLTGLPMRATLSPDLRSIRSDWSQTDLQPDFVLHAR